MIITIHFEDGEDRVLRPKDPAKYRGLMNAVRGQTIAIEEMVYYIVDQKTHLVPGGVHVELWVSATKPTRKVDTSKNSIAGHVHGPGIPSYLMMLSRSIIPNDNLRLYVTDDAKTLIVEQKGNVRRIPVEQVKRAGRKLEPNGFFVELVDGETIFIPIALVPNMIW